MANKIDNVLDAIETKLKELVSADGTGVLKSVRRGVINPLTLDNPPVCSIALSRFYDEDLMCVCEVMLMACDYRGGEAADERVTNLYVELRDKLVALIEAGTAGGAIDKLIFDTWYHPIGGNLQKVGVLGSMRIVLSHPLKT